jgi:hypothetical protein
VKYLMFGPDDTAMAELGMKGALLAENAFCNSRKIEKFTGNCEKTAHDRCISGKVSLLRQNNSQGPMHHDGVF